MSGFTIIYFLTGFILSCMMARSLGRHYRISGEWWISGCRCIYHTAPAFVWIVGHLLLWPLMIAGIVAVHWYYFLMGLDPFDEDKNG